MADYRQEYRCKGEITSNPEAFDRGLKYCILGNVMQLKA